MHAPIDPASGPALTAVFVHSYHIAAPRWTEVCWGEPPHALGRGPAAVRAALEFGADRLIFGMGGAKANWSPEDPDVMYPMLQRRLEELARFDDFTPARVEAARELLSNRVILAPDANGSTIGELEGLRPLLETLGAERLILVSGPDHLPRCLRDAHRVFSASPVRTIAGVMSDTLFADALPVIVEKPHRPDRPGTDLHDVTERLLRMPANAREHLLATLATD